MQQARHNRRSWQPQISSKPGYRHSDKMQQHSISLHVDRCVISVAWPLIGRRQRCRRPSTPLRSCMTTRNVCLSILLPAQWVRSCGSHGWERFAVSRTCGAHVVTRYRHLARCMRNVPASRQLCSAAMCSSSRRIDFRSGFIHTTSNTIRFAGLICGQCRSVHKEDLTVQSGRQARLSTYRRARESTRRAIPNYGCVHNVHAPELIALSSRQCGRRRALARNHLCRTEIPTGNYSDNSRSGLATPPDSTITTSTRFPARSARVQPSVSNLLRQLRIGPFSGSPSAVSCPRRLAESKNGQKRTGEHVARQPISGRYWKKRAR
ncbi:hypothetical protein ABIA39_006120 [Nocardia sp. GAS34]